MTLVLLQKAQDHQFRSRRSDLIKAQSDKIWNLLSKEAEIQRVATGFMFTEGPIWNPSEKYLLFSDIPANICRKLTIDGQISEARNPSQKSNGLTYDKNLNLLACEHLSSSLVLIDQDGKRKILAASFEGKELNSPNDLCVRLDGSIYFTDPPYGRMPGFGKEREQDLGFQGVFRLTPGQDLQLAVEPDTYKAPNGLCFSPDESLLYINDSSQALIDVYNVNPDGSLSGRRCFAKNIGNGELEQGIPDGMKCDELGNVWVTGPGGIWIYDDKGEFLGIIEIPENVGNFHWGGTDWRTLFIAASTSIYTLRTKTLPHSEPFMNAL